jgi:L-cysteine S-thiosulfotransferase
MNKKSINSLFIIYFILLTLLNNRIFAETPISGFEFLSKQAQEMQLDDFQNPGYLFIEKGLEIYNKKNDNNLSCVNCHGFEGKNLNPASIAQYPKYSPLLKKPLTLRDQVQRCWTVHLDNFPMLPDDTAFLALETFVRNKAIGEKVNVDISKQMKPYYETGKELYFTLLGQLDMNCAQCHDIYNGKMLRGQRLSQGHSNGFPEFRLESQEMVNLTQRLRECFRSLRAETYEQDSDEFRNLEIYLNARGNGLKIETPAIRY